jgi:hypothetical protein
LTPIALKPAFAALLLALLHCGVARAADTDPPMFSFAGFGTFGVVHSSEDQADFTTNIFKPGGAGYSHDWSVGVDSLIAAQVTAGFSPQLSAVLQVISEQNYDGSYRPHAEWANLKYQFTPDFSVRAGRTALPFFMVTDSRKIGYANPWVRPPVELYSLVPFTSNDGVDASYRTPLGAAINTFQLSAGQSDSRFQDNGGTGTGTVEARRMFALVDTVEQGFATLHFSYGWTRLTIPQFSPLFDGFRQFGAEGEAIADRYDVDGRHVTFVGIGASYDPGRWFAMSEWGQIQTHSALGDNTGWYASGGYRLAKFTLYLSYAQVKQDSTTSDPGLSTSELPPEQAAAADELNAALNSILGTTAVQKTVSVGGRWDFARSAALKMQLDHSDHGAGSAGTLINLQPGLQLGGQVNVFSLTVDFVF